ncbi:peptidylprolyl isomerase [Clostridium aestuarii]|uniref:Foldase protein PrsA n=1 Tax=Clostridium aestuarii TaxID=338193 RepID=A0ABT4D6S6_9CLOT|nr:peptidylprolyl isomerase [Clostridium aestuarii]
MKKITKIVTVVLISMFAMSISGCSMIEKTPEAIAKEVVAKVNGKKITRKEFNEEWDREKKANYQIMSIVKQMESNYGENYEQNEQVKPYLKQLKISVLNNMAFEQAILQEAEKLKLVPNEEELNKEVDNKITDFRKEQKLEDDKKYEETLKSEGFTKEEYKEAIRNNTIIEKFRDEIIKDVKVEDNQIKEYYDKFKDKYPIKEEESTKLQLAHILVKDEAVAKDIKGKLDKGEDFAKLAKEYGTDGTKDKGGDLGTVTVVNSGFDQEFMNGAMQLKNGEISEPVKTQFGYHIIKCIKREEKPVKSFEAVKEQIKSDLLNKNKNDAWSNKLNEIKEGSKIKVYEEEIV